MCPLSHKRVQTGLVKGGNNLVSTNYWRGEEEKGERSKEKDKISEKKTIEGDI